MILFLISQDADKAKRITKPGIITDINKIIRTFDVFLTISPKTISKQTSGEKLHILHSSVFRLSPWSYLTWAYQRMKLIPLKSFQMEYIPQMVQFSFCYILFLALNLLLNCINFHSDN